MENENTALKINEQTSTPNERKPCLWAKLGVDRWISPLRSVRSGWMNFTKLRILGFLFNERDPTKGHTKSQIAVTLNIWEDQTGEMLEQLRKQGFICSEQISFGTDLCGRRRTIRIYHMTELGRFFIHNLDTHFSGIWATKTGKASL